MNVTDYDAVEAAVKETENAFGHLDILVHSAGIASKNAPLDECEIDEWRQVIEIDLNGTFYMNRAVLPMSAITGHRRKPGHDQICRLPDDGHL